MQHLDRANIYCGTNNITRIKSDISSSRYMRLTLDIYLSGS